jgi:hypothetical protein
VAGIFVNVKLVRDAGIGEFCSHAFDFVQRDDVVLITIQSENGCLYVLDELDWWRGPLALGPEQMASIEDYGRLQVRNRGGSNERCPAAHAMTDNTDTVSLYLRKTCKKIRRSL